MSPSRSFRITARLSTFAALAMFGLIVLGSVVRSTGSGLACPDWPLCQGRLIPPFEPHVLIEWSHRMAALLVSLSLLATAGWIALHRELRARLGGLSALMLGLLLAQVLLGALTVWKLLSPSVVNVHLAVALLLFSSVLVLTLIADASAEEETATATRPEVGVRPAFALPLFLALATLAYLQSVLGGAVSSQNAGLACPDWPACNGEWLPSLASLAGLQMLHRYVGYLLLAAVMAAAVVARGLPDPGVRALTGMGMALVVGQIVLGVCNVLLGTPPWASAMHLAAAATLLGLSVIVTFRVASVPAREVDLVAAGAR